jgi:hypothetical protein
MNTNVEKFIRHWQTRRAKGKLFYTIKFGLIWSVSYTLVKELGSYTIFNDGHYSFNIKEGLFTFGFMLLIGYFMALFQWNGNEKRFQLLRNRIDE